MEIVEPKVTYLPCNNEIDHIATCARICYASENNTANSLLTYRLWTNKHRSMFRHAGVYYIIPEMVRLIPKAYIGTRIEVIGHNTYVSATEQNAREWWDLHYAQYKIPIEEAFNNITFKVNKMLRYTFIVETGIDITRELNRKSPNAIAEQSTRYVDFIKKVGIRFKKCHWMSKCNWYKTILYKLMLKVSEWFYKIARNKYGLNLPPQDARFILPLDTMSKVAYTYTVKEWEQIINMRLWNYTGKAHKDAKIVAQMIYNDLVSLGYNIENYNLRDEFSGVPI